MGGVCVLHPQDALRDRFNYNRMPLISPSTSTNDSSKSRGRNPNFIPNSNPKSVSNSNRRKRSPQKKNSDSSRSPQPKSSNFGHNFNGRSMLPRSTAKGGGNFNSGKISNFPNLVMGKVKILKRGQALTDYENDDFKSIMREKEGSEQIPDLESVEMLMTRLGPEPYMVPKQFHLADFYAGSAVASPPPSSLPAPNFFFKKRSPSDAELTKNNDSTSGDLCRLLKPAGFEISI